MLRAYELTGNVADAEDLVSDVFEALIRRPPKDPGTPVRLHRWLRVVLVRRRDDRLRRLYAGTADALAYATEDIESADAEVVTVI